MFWRYASNSRLPIFASTLGSGDDRNIETVEGECVQGALAGREFPEATPGKEAVEDNVNDLRVDAGHCKAHLKALSRVSRQSS